MNIALIVATGQNNIIGNNNQLPWHLPADLAHFKKMTLGKTIIMGRKTFESIGKPLPGRRNIIITRNPRYQIENTESFSSLEQALENLHDQPEIMVIGGAQLFQLSLSIANRIYLTIIHHDFAGDTFFPSIDPLLWREIQREDHSSDEKNLYNYSFIQLERKTT
jgi:dihydrofolate reductase